MLLDASLARMRRRLSTYLSTPPSAEAVPAPSTPPPVSSSCAAAAAAAAGVLSASQDASKRAESLDVAQRRRARRSVRDAAVSRVARLSRRSRIVRDGGELRDVLAKVPARFRGRDLQAVFSTMVDGVALNTLYAAVAGREPVLLLVRDAGGATFGAYTSVPFRAEPHFHGSGEGFVFALRPTPVVYPWTRCNSFFQLGSPDSIAVGAGGSFALFLNSMLEQGSSGESETYGNKCLASANQFDVVVVEAYKLVVPSRLSIEE